MYMCMNTRINTGAHIHMQAHADLHTQCELSDVLARLPAQGAAFYLGHASDSSQEPGSRSDDQNSRVISQFPNTASFSLHRFLRNSGHAFRLFRKLLFETLALEPTHLFASLAKWEFGGTKPSMAVPESTDCFPDRFYIVVVRVPWLTLAPVGRRGEEQLCF